MCANKSSSDSHILEIWKVKIMTKTKISHKNTKKKIDSILWTDFCLQKCWDEPSSQRDFADVKLTQGKTWKWMAKTRT